jgi:hypothetical protein
VLIGFIDDATGTVFARFYEYEGTIPVMDCFKKYVNAYGLPHSLYMDKHSAYKVNAKPGLDEELLGIEPMSQFGRAVNELHVMLIHANSPQAKGRIERLFNTFQDRVIKEMRLEGINSIKGGNKFLKGYLPKFNARFSVEALERADMHRALPEGLAIDEILCIKEARVVRNDFTVAYGNKLYQVLGRTNAKKVTVEERISGRIILRHGNIELGYKEIKTRPAQVSDQKRYPVIREGHKPRVEHPWAKWQGGNRYPQNPSYQQKEKVGQKEKELLLV